ncbi:ATP-binding protein [Streptomyces capparidis]
MDPYSEESRFGAGPHGAADSSRLPVPRGRREPAVPASPPPGRAALPAPVARPPRPPLGAGEETAPRGAARHTEILAGHHLLTVGPATGSEVGPCPPGSRPVPEKRDAAERARAARAARPPVPAGNAGPDLPLLERDEVRDRLVRLLSRGHCVRLTGPSGVGRTSLLRAVAAACADVAPDGVVELSGHRRTPADLLYALFAAVFRAPGYRPDRQRLLELLRAVGAVVVVDDAEFGGAALEELAASAPECAFLVAANPGAPAAAPGSAFEEVALTGLGRETCLELLRHAVGRPLEEDETAWAADLWFESEGLPLRFVQAGALLRRRDARRAELAAQLAAADRNPFGVAADDDEDDRHTDGPPAPAPAHEVPLPSLAESAAPAARFAAELDDSARDALRFAVALGGECPAAAHLPALVGDTHGDAALADLVARGLAVPVASHYRLAAGVHAQLARPADRAGYACTAARHYTWWAAHPSVPAERVAAEAEPVLAAMAAAKEEGDPRVAADLARAAAPAFAAALHWGAWERALRTGQESARLAGDVALEAYFHHELGVLALCTGNPDRARAELEASVALRGALADRAGTAAGRRVLALLPDQRDPAEAPTTVLPRAAGTAPLPRITGGPRVAGAAGAVGRRLASAGGPRTLAPRGSRRNLAAAGAGVLIAAVLGTVVTLGSASETGHTPKSPMNVAPADNGDPQRAPERPDTPDTEGPARDTPAPRGGGPAVAPDPSTSSAVPPALGTTGRPGGGTAPDSPSASAPGRESTAPGGGQTEPSSPSAPPDEGSESGSASPDPSQSESSSPPPSGPSTPPESSEPPPQDPGTPPDASGSAAGPSQPEQPGQPAQPEQPAQPPAGGAGAA